MVIDLYEGNGGQLFLARDQDAVTLFADKYPGTAITDLETATSTFREDASAWSDWANDAEQPRTDLATLTPDWCPLVASYDSATGEITIYGTLGWAATAYLGADAPKETE